MNRNPRVVACALLLAATTLLLSCKKKPLYAEVPSGPESGRTGSVLAFTSSATDPSGDSVSIRFDWGDGDTSDWSAWFAGGAVATDSHSWSAADTHLVRAQARNLAGSSSEWSKPLVVTIVETWTTTFGGPADDEGYAVVASADGGYVVAGHTSSFGAGSDDIYVVKADASGNQVWAKTFGESGSDAGYSIAPTSDGGYVVAGVSWSAYSAYSVRLIKLDASGNLVEGGSIGGDGVDIGRSVAQTSDGGYIVLGETDPDGNNLPDIYFIRTDSSGNQVWAKTFDGGGADHGYSVRPTSDGGFILAGQTAGGGGGYVYLIKTDADGNKVWAKALGRGQSDVGRSVRQTADGGYVIAGATALAGSFDVYLLKTDANGDTLWTRTYGGSDMDVGYSVQLTADGGYVVAGSTENHGAGGQDVWLIKTDSLGNVGP